METYKTGKKPESYYKELVDEQRDIFLQNAAVGRTQEEFNLIKSAYEFAYQAHGTQRRCSGEPYILHPISVARIVTEEMKLGTGPIVASLLHDVVEDTPNTIEDIKNAFGDEIATMVQGLTKTKRKKKKPKDAESQEDCTDKNAPEVDAEDSMASLQVENIRKMLMTIEYDIRILLIKLADRLHNMRTLGSLTTPKQMKITGETDFFYAPLANRLGMNRVKSELENLSFKFRSPEEYNKLEKTMADYATHTEGICKRFIEPIQEKLNNLGFLATVTGDMRSVFSVWRHMKLAQAPFEKLECVHVFNIIFDPNSGPDMLSEKNKCLLIYSLLTDLYNEKVGSFHNYVDNPKANGYKAIHCKFMTETGTWAEVHIKSKPMQENAMRGCLVEREANVHEWVESFRTRLKEMAYHDGFTSTEGFFLEGVKASLYSDDIHVYTPGGKQILLPLNATALDFAFEIHSHIGFHAQFARINGKLCSIKTPLKRSDRVEIGTNDAIQPQKDWLDAVCTYKAKTCIRSALRKQKISMKPSRYRLASCCSPLPCDELFGFEDQDGSGRVYVHTRNCEQGIFLSTQKGETIVEVNLDPDDMTYYPAKFTIFAIDRQGLVFDMLVIVSRDVGLNITSLTVTTKDSLVEAHFQVKVRSAKELRMAMERISAVPGVEEVKRVPIKALPIGGF